MSSDSSKTSWTRRRSKLPPLTDRKTVKRELCERSLRDFIRLSWPVVEPAKAFLPNWHIDAIDEHLQAVYDRQIQFLLISVPPGHAQSLIVSVQFPAWLWVKDPAYRIITGTYAGDLTIRDAVRARDLVTSPWFRE